VSPLKGAESLVNREERARLRFPGAENRECELRPWLQAKGSWSRLALLLAAMMSLPMSPVLAQDAAPLQTAQVDGIVRDTAGKAVAGATVRLQEEGSSNPSATETNADGAFVFLAVRAGTYTVKLEKSGFRAAIEDSIKLAPAEKKHCDFVLRASAESAPPSTPASSPAAIELDDRPNFTVAGITDSTGAGGHGSETRLRTGEALAKETLNLESGESKEALAAAPKAGTTDHNMQASESVLRAALLQSPRSFEANHKLGEFYLHSERCREAIPLLETAYHANPGDHPNALDLALAFKACGEFAQARGQLDQMLASENEKQLGKQDEADLRRLLGDLDEKLEDPLAAVREYERAAGLDASEQNYFAWGAELLLHRAAAPAIEVFGRGVHSHPDSARMLAGLGAALYTSGSAEEAAQRLCDASDLEPANPAPYLFLGKIQDAASAPLPCAEQKLARFAHDRPGSALANYYYALALLKRNRGSQDPETLEHAKALLEKSSAIDSKLDLAYLQLGNLYASRGALPEALAAYQKAVTANPAGSEAHYRLGLTYKRVGEESKAQREFEDYKRLDKTEAATIDRQRRELRQFLFVLKDQVPKDQVPKDQVQKDQPSTSPAK
jgi:tetratricopeptide (TPR) repeat protein